MLLVEDSCRVDRPEGLSLWNQRMSGFCLLRRSDGAKHWRRTRRAAAEPERAGDQLPSMCSSASVLMRLPRVERSSPKPRAVLHELKVPARTRQQRAIMICFIENNFVLSGVPLSRPDQRPARDKVPPTALISSPTPRMVLQAGRTDTTAAARSRMTNLRITIFLAGAEGVSSASLRARPPRRNWL